MDFVSFGHNDVDTHGQKIACLRFVPGILAVLSWYLLWKHEEPQVTALELCNHFTRQSGNFVNFFPHCLAFNNITIFYGSHPLRQGWGWRMDPLCN